MTFQQLELFERWLPVVGYEGKYEVSDWGRVRRVATLPKHRYGRLLNPSKIGWGYFRVYLGYSQPFTVHRLVMAAFTGPCPPGKEIHHIDGDKSHNSVLNLKYVTKDENIQEDYKAGRRVGKLTRNQVIEVKRLAKEGMTQVDIARHFGIHSSTVSVLIAGKTWKHV